MRKVFNAAVLVALALTTVAAQTTKPAAVTITGKWTVSLQTDAFTSTPTVEFKSQEGEKITGVYTGRYGSYPFEGKLKERALEFSFKMSAEGTDVEMWFGGRGRGGCAIDERPRDAHRARRRDVDRDARQVTRSSRQNTERTEEARSQSWVFDPELRDLRAAPWPPC